MKPKYDMKKRKMVLDQSNQRSHLEYNSKNVSKIQNEILNLLKTKERSLKTLKEFNDLLNSEQNMSNILNTCHDQINGSFLHYLTLNSQASDEISWRMVYALSNAGIDVNIQDSKGNTALHIALMRGYAEIGFEFIEALLKIGLDFRIKNNNGKLAIDYMEDLTQLRCMYEAHFPGVWAAADKSDINIFYRLINGFVKLNTFKKGQKLSSYVRDRCVSNKGKILNLIDKYSEIIDFVHAIYALDFDLIKNLRIQEKFDPNMADFSYCFSWFKPFCRNIPKFLLEISIETKQMEFIKYLLSNGSDVNLPNSKTGNPLYFSAFEPELVGIREEIMSMANLNVKNHKGQSILFYLVDLFSNEKANDKNDLVKSFSEILNRHPMLLTHRDQEESSLIEEIMSKNPSDFKNSIIFLKEISNFTLKLLENRNFKVFQEMFYQSYGLVLLNTPIYLSSCNDFETISFEDYIETYNHKEIKIYFKKIFNSNFVENAKSFLMAIYNGDLKYIKELFKLEKNYSFLKIRDYSGRSCLHLACLYGQPDIVKFLLQNDSKLLKSIDNSNRTALHYAYAIKNQSIIAILESYDINKFARDSKFLLAEEYQLEEVLNDNWFAVKDFKKKQMQSYKAIETFMMCFQFNKFRLAIEDNNLELLKILNAGLKFYDLSIIDFPIQRFNFQDNQDSISLLDIAIKHKSFSAFRYILEQYYENFKNKSNNIENLKKKHFDLYLSDLRERAEDLESYEIIDIIDNTIEDREIAEITNSNINVQRNNELTIQNIMKKNVNTSNQLLRIPKPNYSIENDNSEKNVSKEAKVCSIL